MWIKNAFVCALLLAALGGCAAPPAGSLSSLRDDSLLRDERRLSMTFAQVQQALLRRQRLCGQAPTFSLHPRDTNAATVVHAPSDPARNHDTILVELQQVYGWEGFQLIAKTYAGLQVSQDAIHQVFDAMHNATSCPAR